MNSVMKLFLFVSLSLLVYACAFGTPKHGQKLFDSASRGRSGTPPNTPRNRPSRYTAIGVSREVGSEVNGNNSTALSYSSEDIRLKGDLRRVLLPPNTDLSLSAREMKVLADKAAAQAKVAESGEGPSDLDVLRESLRQLLDSF